MEGSPAGAPGLCPVCVLSLSAAALGCICALPNYESLVPGAPCGSLMGFPWGRGGGGPLPSAFLFTERSTQTSRFPLGFPYLPWASRGGSRLPAKGGKIALQTKASSVRPCKPALAQCKTLPQSKNPAGTKGPRPHLQGRSLLCSLQEPLLVGSIRAREQIMPYFPSHVGFCFLLPNTHLPWSFSMPCKREWSPGSSQETQRYADKRGPPEHLPACFWLHPAPGCGG